MTMEYITRILLGGIGRMLAYLTGSTYVAYINIKDIHEATNGLITISIGLLTVIFLWYQIKLIRKKLKEGKK